jgi:hypothetical protein
VAGSVFINDGGILCIDQLGVVDVTAMSLVFQSYEYLALEFNP